MADQPPMSKRMEEYVQDLQNRIVEALEAVDPNAPKFKRDAWTRPEGGYGISCVFNQPSEATAVSPSILEKAGVNISVVHGSLPPRAIAQMRANHAEIPHDLESDASLPFFVAGLSLVIHPRNPHAPTVHANYRYFDITVPGKPSSEKDEEKKIWWFGGGCDLTPTYLVEEDAKHFHTTMKEACDPHGKELYPAFKKWCDQYFFIPHRKECRGVGGIFFDDLSHLPHTRLSEEGNAEKPKTADENFAFVKSCGDSFIPSYIPILEKRAKEAYSDEQRRWQLIRRGRYVEFNLMYDRGTKFGLHTPGARIESILMSLPETARWEYMSDMGTNEESEEGKIMAVLKNPRDWVQ